MLELFTGVVVAMVALAALLEPLLRRDPAWRPVDTDADDWVSPEESESPKVRALVALREIEFDRATGKLSDTDYQELKARYSADAVAAMRDEPAAGGDGAADPVEEIIQRARGNRSRSCPGCGPRPETNAVFCSTCGRSLATPGAAPRCWVCGDSLPDGARFCAACGSGVELDPAPT